jgi:CRP/FNR family transcriptional regulator, cyclic AMP receptor protein
MVNESVPVRMEGTSEWLRLVPESFRTALMDGCIVRDYAPGDGIFRHEDSPIGLVGLVSGMARVDVAPNERGPSLGHFVRPGNWVGAVAVLAQQDHFVSLTATRASTAAILPVAALNHLAMSDKDTWRYIGLLVATNMKTAIGFADDLMIRAPSMRLAAVMLRLAGVRNADNPLDPEPELDINQSELAALANLSRATAAKLISRWQDTGMLACNYRKIRLLRAKSLRDVVANRF